MVRGRSRRPPRERNDVRSIGAANGFNRLLAAHEMDWVFSGLDRRSAAIAEHAPRPDRIDLPLAVVPAGDLKFGDQHSADKDQQDQQRTEAEGDGEGHVSPSLSSGQADSTDPDRA